MNSSVGLSLTIYIIVGISVLQAVLLVWGVKIEHRTSRSIWAHLPTAAPPFDDPPDEDGRRSLYETHEAAVGSYTATLWSVHPRYVWIIADSHKDKATKIGGISDMLRTSATKLMEHIVTGRVDTISYDGKMRQIQPQKARRSISDWEQDIPSKAGRLSSLREANVRARYFVFPSTEQFDSYYDKTNDIDIVVLCCHLNSVATTSLPIQMDKSDAVPAIFEPTLAHVLAW